MVKATITVCDACGKMASRIPVAGMDVTLEVGKESFISTFDTHLKDRCIWNNLRMVRENLTLRVETKFPTTDDIDDDDDDDDDDDVTVNGDDTGNGDDTDNDDDDGDDSDD